MYHHIHIYFFSVSKLEFISKLVGSHIIGSLLVFQIHIKCFRNCFKFLLDLVSLLDFFGMEGNDSPKCRENKIKINKFFKVNRMKEKKNIYIYIYIKA